jgi:hypothetical protein
VDEDTWRAVYTLLNDPARRLQQGNEPAWLGSGIYRCGLCGGPLRAAPYGGTPKTANRDRRYLYRCTTTAHLTISAEKTDAFVRGVVAELVRDPRVVAGMAPGDDDGLSADRERRVTFAARLEAFESDYAQGAITGQQLAKATATVEAQLAEVDARLATGLQRSAALPIARASDPGRAFLDAPLDVQRAVLRQVLHVEVQSATKQGAAWSEKRLMLSRVA